MRVAEGDVRMMTSSSSAKRSCRESSPTTRTCLTTKRRIGGRCEIAGRDAPAQTEPARRVENTPDLEKAGGHEDAEDLDFELRLVDFRPPGAAHLAIAAGAAIAIIVAAVVGLTRPPLTLPTPWLDAPAGSARASAGSVNDIAPTTLQDTTRANLVRPWGQTLQCSGSDVEFYRKKRVCSVFRLG